MADMKQKIAEALKILNPESRSVTLVQRDIPCVEQTNSGQSKGKSNLDGNCSRNDDCETKPHLRIQWILLLLALLFTSEVIVRLLIEFPLSAESDPKDWERLVLHHFAYLVEGDPFLAAQSSAWRSLAPNLKHYRFMTGSGCLDVITSATPRLGILDADRETDALQ